ncbi:hypothetical protein [Orrella sp. 11846]|uniref:hypothetical protein n=1 Tax=Orrella sp. 11846 TaxID=3409913 RepID=UPI003B5C85B4
MMKQSSSKQGHKRLPVKLTILAALLAIGGCTQFKDVPPGTPFSELESTFGKPTVLCDLEDGSKRAVWSQQPSGQTAWAVDISKTGETGQLEQVLTNDSFERLRRGIWTAEDLRCTFGPPAEDTMVGPSGSRKVVWSYRYLQSDVWHSLMSIYLGPEGKQVTNFHPGPDPWFSEDADFSKL